MKFYSPYQFIPLPDAARQQTLTSFADIQDGKTPFVRHDRWDSEALSGRILCTLETCSPLVVGA